MSPPFKSPLSLPESHQKLHPEGNATSLSMIATIQGAGETPAAPTCIAAILAAPEARWKRAVR